MKRPLFFLALIAALAGGAVWLAKRQPTAAGAASASVKPERKILYYQSPMHPWIKSDKPGKCPICGMNMVPVYADAGDTNTSTGFGLKLNTDSVNVANVQTAPVERRQIVRTLRVSGNISVNSWTESWFEFDAYERDISWLKIGQTIEVQASSIPGKLFTAEIKLHGARPYADQKFDSTSDSTKVRAEITSGPVALGDFGPGKLFSGVYAEGNVRAKTPEVLAVPRSAVLSPDAQPVVYVDEGKGYYEQRKVKLGRVGDEFVEVLDGLKEGDKVVTSGNLLIDAEAQISKSSDN
jgi:multidrug efflux pump subunit AcrA (membrane-fusion protein)